MAAPVTALSAPRRRVDLLAAASLLLLAGCYGGDFFDRLVDPTATAAFRITRLVLIDPHTYIGDTLKCDDSTAELNAIIANNIASFDVNTTLVLHPLDPTVTSGAKLEIVPANCVPGGELVNCTDKDVDLAEIVSADFNNSVGGTCGNPVAMSLNPAYQGGGNEALHQAMSPCFLSATIPKLGLKLALDVPLPLSNVQIYASYALDDQPHRLVSGVLLGFVPASVAKVPIGELNEGPNNGPFALWPSLAGGGACQPSDMFTDIDSAAPEDGVWMYFNFTAELVAWSPENALPGTSTGEPTTTADPMTTAGLTTTSTTGATTGPDLTTGSTGSTGPI